MENSDEEREAREAKIFSDILKTMMNSLTDALDVANFSFETLKHLVAEHCVGSQMGSIFGTLELKIKKFKEDMKVGNESKRCD